MNLNHNSFTYFAHLSLLIDFLWSGILLCFLYVILIYHFL